MNRARRWILNGFSRLLYGRWANPLSRVVESVQVARPDVLLRTDKIRTASIVNYNYPPHYDSFFRRTQAFPDRFVFELKQAVVLKGRGFVLTSDGMILQESAGPIRRLFRHGSLLEELQAPVRTLHLPHPCSYLPCKPFYHFLLEEIPALLYARAMVPDLLVLVDEPEQAPRYYAEALQLIFGETIADRTQVIRGTVSTERYVLTQRDPFSSHISPDEIPLLNRCFLPEPGREGCSRKLYISRRKAAGRRICNESELETLLGRTGYQVVCLEDLPLQQQINLVADSKFLVSPHGAGLSHLVWNPSCHKAVLEIFPSTVRNDAFASLACLLGHDYTHLVCAGGPAGETVDLGNLETELERHGML